MKIINLRKASDKSRVYFMWLWLRIGEKLMDPEKVDQEAMSYNIDEANRLRNSIGVEFRECSSGERLQESQRILRRMYDWTKELAGE